MSEVCFCIPTAYLKLAAGLLVYAVASIYFFEVIPERRRYMREHANREGWKQPDGTVLPRGNTL